MCCNIHNMKFANRCFSYIIICVMMLAFSVSANAQVEAFKKYSNSKDITYVYISKAMLRFAGGKAAPSVPGVDMKGLSGKLSGIQIITSDSKAARTRLENETMDIVKANKYELLMQVDDDGEKVRIYSKEGKKQSVIIMYVDETDETSVIVFSGTFTMSDIEKMMK